MKLLPAERREAKRAMRETADADACERLLRHSIAYGHHRLALQRFMILSALGGRNLDEYFPAIRCAVEHLDPDALVTAQNEAERRLARVRRLGLCPVGRPEADSRGIDG